MGKKREIGFGWGDIANAGQTAFPYIHTAGSGVLSAFGAGALVAPITNLEQQGGLLPPAAKPDHVIAQADFAIAIYTDPTKQPTVASRPDSVAVFGGKRFDGNGYAGPTDLGKKFSFGFDAPTQVDVIVQGKKTSISGLRQVLLCGGIDTKTTVAGAAMSIKQTILGILGIGESHDFTADNYAIGAMQSNPYIKGSLALANRRPSISSPPSFGFQFKTTPKGRKITSLVLNKDRPHDPKKTIQAARTVVQRAQQSAAKTLARVAKAENTITKKAHVLGAMPVKPKALVSLALLKQRANALLDASHKLSDHVEKYAKVVSNQKTKNAAAAARGKQATGIHGFDFQNIVSHEQVRGIGEMSSYFTDILGMGPMDGGYFTDIMGASWDEIMGDDEELNMSNWDVYSVLGDIVTDPATGQQIDSTTGQPVEQGASGTSSQLPGPPTYGAGSPPVQAGSVITKPDGSTWPTPGQDYLPDPYPNGDDPTFWDCPTDDDLPLGAVVFDGSRTPPHMGLGNYTVFNYMLPGAGPPKGGPPGPPVQSDYGSGYSYHADGKWWLELLGTQPSFNYDGNHNYDTVANPDGGMAFESKKNNWGPLMGNPKTGWTKGLRFSPSGPNGPRWFWFWDLAPDWAKATVVMAAMNDQITQYKAAVTAAQTDYVNAQLQDSLSQQEATKESQAQAASDGQTARQQQQADAQSAVAQQQLADRQAAAAQAQQEAQAQLDQQTMQAQLAYFQAHPEAMFVPGSQAADQGQGQGQEQAPQSTADQFGTAPDYGQQVDEQAAIDWGDGGGGGLSDSSTDELTQEADSLFPSAE